MSILVTIGNESGEMKMTAKSMAALPETIEKVVRAYAAAHDDDMLFLMTTLELASCNPSDSLKALSESCKYNEDEERIMESVSEMCDYANDARSLILRANKAIVHE